MQKALELPSQSASQQLLVLIKAGTRRTPLPVSERTVAEPKCGIGTHTGWVLGALVEGKFDQEHVLN